MAIFKNINAFFSREKNLKILTEQTIQTLDYLFLEVSEIKELLKSNTYRPSDIRARNSYSREKFIETKKDVYLRIKNLLKIFREIEERTKEITLLQSDSTDDCDKKIISIIQEINPIIHEANLIGISTLALSQKENEKIQSYIHYVFYSQSLLYGENFQRAGIPISQAEIESSRKKAQYYEEDASEARNLSKMVFENIKKINENFFLLDEYKIALNLLLNPSNETNVISEGDKEYDLGNTDTAIKYYNAVSLVDPNNPVIKNKINKIIDTRENFFINEGDRHYNRGNLSAALKSYENALKLNPNNEIVKYNRDLVVEKMKEMSDNPEHNGT